jgi:predicted MPP superfamily phosphohydrolase
LIPITVPEVVAHRLSSALSIAYFNGRREGIHATGSHVRLKTMEIAIDKAAGGRESLKVVFFADTHVGPFLRTSRLEKIVELINRQNPDLVLIAGDVYDEGLPPEELERLPLVLRRIRSRDGVFASPGNHEFFAGIRQSEDIFAKSGITFLRDRVEFVAGSYYVAGRSTRTYLGPDRRRVPLATILAGVDKNFPVILLEHVPVHLEEAAEAGVDLQLSGHTHGGGAFPATLINGLLYDIGAGYGRRGNTQVYVTTGVGVWSPPIRVGTTAEIVLMKLNFRKIRGIGPESGNGGAS